MSELTPRLGIKKPLGNETVTRAAFNENWDIIDSGVATKSDLDGHVGTGGVVHAVATTGTAGFMSAADKVRLDTMTLPIGIIVMWNGSAESIPLGWALCDGTNGTPDLRDRFVLGAGSSYFVGATGGAATHTLTVNEMPAHTHSYMNATVMYGTASGSNDRLRDTTTANTGSTGGGTPHNNMPPYYALCYIMRIA